MNTDVHEYHLETEVKGGIERTILVIVTDIPIPPQTHIDKEMLPEVVQTIRQINDDSGTTVHDIRLVHRNSNSA